MSLITSTVILGQKLMAFFEHKIPYFFAVRNSSVSISYSSEHVLSSCSVGEDVFFTARVRDERHFES